MWRIAPWFLSIRCCRKARRCWPLPLLLWGGALPPRCHKNRLHKNCALRSGAAARILGRAAARGSKCV